MIRQTLNLALAVSGLATSHSMPPSNETAVDDARLLNLPMTAERRTMFAELEQLLGRPVLAYVWAFRKIHPVWLLVISFAISQTLNEILIYVLFEAYGTRGITRTLFEILSPLTLWLLVDTVIQFALAVVGRGHRLLVQTTVSDELLVFHRRLFSAKPERLDCRIRGSLAMTVDLMGYAIDRLDTDIGRFYVWARWRDIRVLVGLAAPHPDP